MNFFDTSLLLGCGCLLALAGCSSPSGAADQAGKTPRAAAALDRVAAAPPRRQSLSRSTTQPGRILPFEETPLYAKLPGYAAEVKVDIGDRVTRGQVLITLAIPELEDDGRQKEALVAQAKAAAAAAQAGIATAAAAARSATAKTAQAEASTGRAAAEYERWRAEYERIRELAERGSVTTKLADETLQQFQAAQAARREVEAAVASAEALAAEADARVRRAEAEHALALAQVAVAEADLARTETLRAYAAIKAPFDGVVTRRQVDTGHYVHPATGPSATPLLVVTRADKVRVYVDIPEGEAPLVAAGDPAIVRVRALETTDFTASVVRTAWSLDEANHSLRTEIDVDNPDGVLRPGMYATITILLDARDNALVLPVSALVREGEATYCCRVVEGKIQRVPVRLGLRSGAEVEIVEGIADSDLIVTVRAGGLTDGQAVEVIAPP